MIDLVSLKDRLTDDELFEGAVRDALLTIEGLERQQNLLRDACTVALGVLMGEMQVSYRDRDYAKSMLRKALTFSETTEDVCLWGYEDSLDYSVWGTGCGSTWVLDEGTPHENSMRYCPYCGKRITGGEFPPSKK